MASVTEVYGDKYNQEACYGRLNYSAKVLANNIAELSFNIRHESDTLWDGNNMKPEAIKLIIDKVQNINPHFMMDHINKTSCQTNMLPYLIDGAVEYFRIIDLNRNRLYLIYITPDNMEPF